MTFSPITRVARNSREMSNTQHRPKETLMATKAAPKPKAAPKKSEREPVYPEVKVILARGDKALTAEKAKEYLGWEVMSKEAGTASELALLTDADGNKVRCTNNLHNRRFVEGWAYQMAQDLLNKRWRFNGEACIIGRFGSILSCQHRLIMLVLAEQIRLKQEPHFKSKGWEGPVTLDTVIVTGVDEDNETTRTLDNVRPRTLADTLEAMGFYKNDSPKDRDKLNSMTDHAIRLLWHRTGRDDKEANPFGMYRTHSESIEFLDRHKTLAKAVRHVYTENSDSGVQLFMSPGYMSALMYLMASSDTDETVYNNAKTPGEAKMDFGQWEKAEGFITALAQAGSKKPSNGDNETKRRGPLKDLPLLTWQRKGIDANGEEKQLEGYYFTEGDGRGSVSERTCILLKAWGQWKEKGKVYVDDCRPTYKDDEEPPQLTEWPTCGGIDQGEYREEAKEKAATERAEKEAEKAEKEQQAKEEAERKDQEERDKGIGTLPEEAPATVKKPKPKPKAASAEEPSGPVPRVNGEVPPADPIAYDGNGKPPAPAMKPKPRPGTRKAVEAKQTEKAMANDEEDARLKEAQVVAGETSEEDAGEAEPE